MKNFNNQELEHLSDDELRLRLLQYGYQNIPITQTTRRTLLKKLSNFMNQANTNLQKKSSLIAKFSSDEESNEQTKSSKMSHRLTNNNKSNGNGNVYISPVFLSESNDDSFLRKQQGNRSNTLKNDNIDLDSNISYASRRLLQLRKSNNLGSCLSSSKGFQREEQASSFNGTYKNKFTDNVKTSFNRFVHYLRESFWTAKQTYVPMFLIAILVIFFAFLIVMYINMSPDIETSLQHSITYDSCSESDSHTSLGCINESKMEELLKILKLISSELRRKIKKDECSRKSTEKVVWCVHDVHDYLMNQDKSEIMPQSGNSLMNRLHDVQYLIQKNSFLGLKNVNSDGKIMNDDDIKNESAEYCFALLSTRSPWHCSVYAKIHIYFAIIGSFTAIGMAAFGIRKIYLFLVSIRNDRRRKVNQTIDDIVNYVLNEYSDDKGKCIYVNDMRAKLSISNKNVEQNVVWTEALAFLEKNDSRIHFGCESIENGDVKIIRRIPIEKDDDTSIKSNSFLTNTNNDKAQNGNSKKWMGPAFDKSNKIKDPPTNCLKIRQMFDKYEINNPNLLTIIKDTILLKVAERKCKIYDIQLDKKTCCVYVKCKSCADAGIIHEEMNGWWLDQRLIVVKFLREDKYNQRFKDPYFS